VQAPGLGCPSAAIVMEELVQLGVERFLRVGTCGGLQPDLELGDLIVALTAVPPDGTARHCVRGEAHCPTADWELVHGAVHAAKGLDQPMRVGPIASSDTFYDPDEERHGRWSARGVLAVEMEAAVIFTIGALRKVQAGCLLTVSDIVVGGAFTRISDEDLQAAVDRLARVPPPNGTVNEIVNGIAGLERVELAVVHRGTGGDFVRTFGIPHKLEDALDVSRSPRSREIDLGRATLRTWAGREGSTWFANIASAGMS